MAWLLMSLRRAELTRSISDHTYEKLQISRQMRKLSSFSNAIGDGKITPSEIASLGTDLFGEALDFIGYSSDAANEAAEEQFAKYEEAYGFMTQQDYYQNSGIASRAELYFDPETGQLDKLKMCSEFYEQALKEYAEKVVMPRLKELEEELEDKKNNLDTLVEAEQAELQQLKQSVSTEIQNSTIKLS